MNAPLRKIQFEAAMEPRLMRPDHMRVTPKSMGECFAGAAITVVAHVAAITGLVLGFHAARPLLAPKTITVSIEEKRVEQRKLDIVLPAFTPPPQMSAPVPMFTVAPNPEAIAVAPPIAETTPPAPASAGQGRDAGETRATYLGRLLAHLNRFKLYPAEARSARIQGVVMLRFVMDRRGKVLTAEIVKSSGRPALDQAAMAMIDHAQPLPAMPASMPDDTLDAVVPVHFSLR
jgi:protein TonB